MISFEEIKEMMDKSQNPLIFFDDDPDGVCSFLLLYKYLKRGHGVIVKSSPMVKAEPYLNKVREYDPDLVLVLDKPMCSDEFLDGIDCPVIWIDHHDPQNPQQKNVFYHNPHLEDKYEPTSTLCYRIVNENEWIAMVGTTGDWHYDKGLKKKFLDQYPNYFDPKINKAPDVLFQTKIGLLVKVIAFNLKGKLSDVKKSIKVFTRIEDPDEILEEKTPAGKFLMKKFKKVNEFYKRLKQKAIDAASESPYLVLITPQPSYSFSSELSNEILYLYPKKIIFIGRTSNGATKCSIRTALDIDLRDAVATAVAGFGYGGGHKQACGAYIEEGHFDVFFEKFKTEIEKQL